MEEKEYAFKRPHEGHNDANFDLLAKSELLTGKNTVEAINENTEKQIEADAENTEKQIEADAESTEKIIASGKENTTTIEEAIESIKLNVNIDNTDIVNSLNENTEKQINANIENTETLGKTLSSNCDSNTLLLIDALNTSLNALNKTLEDGLYIDVKDDIKKIEEEITVLQDNVQSNTDLIDSSSIFSLGQTCTRNTDLNDYTVGHYSASGSIASTIENVPISGYGFTLFAIFTANETRYAQIIIFNKQDAPNIYLRTFTGDWSDWLAIG